MQTMVEVMNWLLHSQPRIERTDLTRIKKALQLLGDPQSGLPVIHLAGTNGKGSTLAFLNDLLQSQGLTVGTFSSPHIEKINERIQINHQMISDEDFLNLAKQVSVINEDIIALGLGSLSYFEKLTIIGALYFQQCQPDVCLIEVGIGGLLDNTNVFDGQLSVITTIDYDHMDKLGTTLAEIAFQKAGIIKPHAQVIIGNIQDDDALAMIQQTALEKEAEFYQLFDHFTYTIKWLDEKGSTFSFSMNEQEFDVSIQMIGKHQVDNASVAIAAALTWLERYDYSLELSSFVTSIQNTSWPGRLEKIKDQPRIYLDGAHNEAGLRALQEAIKDYFKGQSITLLYAGLAKKDQERHLKILSNFPVKRIVFTEFDAHDQVLNPYEACQILKVLTDKKIEVVYWQHALQNFMKKKSDELMIVTGSLYFISEVRKFLK